MKLLRRLKAAIRLKILLLVKLASAALRRNYKSSSIHFGRGAGLKIAAGPSNSPYSGGEVEQPVQEVIAEILSPGDIFFDVGANVGFFTIIAARIVEPSGRVYAFEPVRANVAVLRQNVQQNGLANVRIIAKAVSDISGDRQLVVAQHSGGSALSEAEEQPPDALGKIKVKSVSIDDLVATKTAKPPSFVKIDVEGAEIRVLNGMSETIARYRPRILIEIDGSEKDVVRVKRERCQTFLEERGYTFKRLRDSYPGSRWLVEHYLAEPGAESTD